MSDESKNPASNEEQPKAKKATPIIPKKNTLAAFNKPNKFISPKSGNPGNKGGMHKGGGMKKGK